MAITFCGGYGEEKLEYLVLIAQLIKVTKSRQHISAQLLLFTTIYYPTMLPVNLHMLVPVSVDGEPPKLFFSCILCHQMVRTAQIYLQARQAESPPE